MLLLMIQIETFIVQLSRKSQNSRLSLRIVKRQWKMLCCFLWERCLIQRVFGGHFVSPFSKGFNCQLCALSFPIARSGGFMIGQKPCKKKYGCILNRYNFDQKNPATWHKKNPTSITYPSKAVIVQDYWEKQPTISQQLFKSPPI